MTRLKQLFNNSTVQQIAYTGCAVGGVACLIAYIWASSQGVPLNVIGFLGSIGITGLGIYGLSTLKNTSATPKPI